MSDSSRARVLVDGIGLTAVLLGLVFVGFEIRQNTAATRAATQQAILDASLQAHWGVMENPRLREVMILVREDPAWVTVTPQTSDHILLERFYWQRFNTLENAFYHYTEGSFDARLWAGWDSWSRGLASDPLMSHYWSILRDGYMPDFIDYIDAALAGGTEG
jgi:hypothetical protein